MRAFAQSFLTDARMVSVRAAPVIIERPTGAERIEAELRRLIEARDWPNLALTALHLASLEAADTRRPPSSPPYKGVLPCRPQR
jgi:hypothetical protein